MNLFIKKFLLVFLLSCTFFSIFAGKSNAQERGVRISPTAIEKTGIQGDIITDKVEIEYINFANPQLEILFKEFNSQYSEGQDSELLQKNSKLVVEQTPSKSILTFTIDTKNMLDKTYFFAYQLLYTNIKSSVSINERIAVNIPVILTININQESVDPKPQIKIENTENLYFDPNEVAISAEFVNDSSKLINFSGELVFLTQNDEIFYTQKLSTQNNRLLPEETVRGQIKPDFALINQGFFPYTGKVKVFYRGVVNNTRHIQTKNIEFTLIPYKTIIVAIGILMILMISGIMIWKRVRRVKMLKS